MTEKDPSDSLFFLHKEIDRLFKNLFSEELLLDRDHFPFVDVIENEDSLRVEIEIPGVEKENVKVEVVGDMLILEGIKRDSESQDRLNYICMERRFGCFRRTVPLPAVGDRANVKASHENGVLIITLPKLRDRRKTIRKIDIE